MHPFFRLSSAALALFPTPAAFAAATVACVSIDDARQRLACYDEAHGRVTAPGTSASQLPVAATGEENDSSIMSRAWELGSADKRGTFVVKTYLPNFILPLHYSSNINRAPTSPSRGTMPGHPNLRAAEAKLQVSLRAKMAENLLLPGADLWFAYTQRSLWQVWDRKDSSPFRSTDYQPEAIYIVPVPKTIGELPGKWRWRLAQFGIAHTSNGQSGSLSRSWNRLYAGVGLEREEVGLQLRYHHRLRERHQDDNPDLMAHIGRFETTGFWFPGHSTLALALRTSFKDAKKGSVQLDWTHPVVAGQPTGLRWYVQLFSGHGETLLDYNHRQNRFGVGLTLFQF